MSCLTSCKFNGESEFHTSISSQIYVFKWNIENFPDWPDIFKVTSSEFKPANDIVLYATFERFIDESEDKKCYLNIISKEKSPFEVEDQLSFTYSTGKVFTQVKPTNFFCTLNEKCWRYIIYPDVLEERSRSREDKIIVFKCIMKFKELATENVNRLRFECSKNVPDLIKDFKTMYTDSLHTDFSFFVDNNVVRVHKSVLCARSPVLARMLKSPLEEKKKDTIEIVDIELPTLKTFVEFLYTGSVPTDVDFDSWCKLYYAADKYDVASLRGTCAEALLDKLDAENSCCVLSLANRHSDSQFVDVLLDFLQRHFNEVMETEDWYKLVMSEPLLAIRVMKLHTQKSKNSTSKDEVALK